MTTQITTTTTEYVNYRTTKAGRLQFVTNGGGYSYDLGKARRATLAQAGRLTQMRMISHMPLAEAIWRVSL